MHVSARPRNQVTVCMHRATSCSISANPRTAPCWKFRHSRWNPPRDRTGVRYISREPSRWGRNYIRETWWRSPCPRGRLYAPRCMCDVPAARRKTLSSGVVCNEKWKGLLVQIANCTPDCLCDKNGINDIGSVKETLFCIVYSEMLYLKCYSVKVERKTISVRRQPSKKKVFNVL